MLWMTIRRLLVPACVVFAGSLTSSTAFAFRTAQELPELMAKSPVAASKSPTRFTIRRTLPSNLRDAATETAIAHAALSWSDPPCSAAAIALEGFSHDPAAPEDGANTIEWITDWSERGFDESAAAFTDIQYQRIGKGQWTIVEADMYLNASFDWSTDVHPIDPVRSVQAVVTHEFGHALGLLHPCELDADPKCTAKDDRSVTMYPLYSDEQATLAPDDIAGICSLYPAPSCKDTGCPDGQTCGNDGQCVAQCGDDVCAPGEVCTSNGCKSVGDCTSKSCIGDLCQTADNCGEFEQCSDNHCTRGPRLEGEACQTSEDCRNGLCVASVCRNSCTTAEQCGAAADCTSVDSDHSACEPTGAELGVACQFPLDCSGQRCLIGAKPSPVCTQRCGDNYPACPAQWHCGEVDRENVCIPVAAHGGCQFDPTLRPSGAPYGALLLVFLLKRRRSFTSQNRSRS